MKRLSEKILNILNNATQKKELNDEIFGKIIVYYIEENKFIIQKTKSTNNQRIIENFSFQTEQRMKLNHNNLLKMIGINEEVKKINNEMEYEISVFYEYSGATLKDFFREAIKKQKKLSDNFLISIIGDILNSIYFLEKNKCIHGNISPSYISIEENTHFRLIDQLINRNLDQDIYVSPEIFEGKEKVDFYKSEIFSLGLVILELGILKPINDIYDFRHFKFNRKNLNGYIELFMKNYEKNHLLKKLLKIMLGYNTKRKSIQNLLNFYRNQVGLKIERKHLEISNSKNDMNSDVNLDIKISDFEISESHHMNSFPNLNKKKISKNPKGSYFEISESQINKICDSDYNYIKNEELKKINEENNEYDQSEKSLQIIQNSKNKNLSNSSKNFKTNSKKLESNSNLDSQNQKVLIKNEKSILDDDEYEKNLITKICNSEYFNIKNEELEKMNKSNNDSYNSEKSLLSYVCNSDYYYIKNEELEKINQSNYNYYCSDKSLTDKEDKYVVINIKEKENLENKKKYNISEKKKKENNNEETNKTKNEDLNIFKSNDLKKTISRNLSNDTNNFVDNKEKVVKNKENEINNFINKKIDIQNKNVLSNNVEFKNKIDKIDKIINNNFEIIENFNNSFKKTKSYIDYSLVENLISKKDLMNVESSKEIFMKKTLNFKKVKRDGKNVKIYKIDNTMIY